MTCALGIAFRSSGDEPVIVGVAEGGGERRHRRRARAGGRLHGPARSQPTTIERAVRDGRAPVVVVAGDAAGLSLRRRRAPRVRPRASRWMRRCSARPAGSDAFTPAQQPVELRRLALHRLARCPGLLGMNIMSTGPVGRRLLDRQRAHAEAVEAAGRDADVARALPGLARAQPAGVSRARGRRARGFGWLAFGVAVRGSIAALAVICARRRAVVRRHRAARQQPRADDRGACRGC